MRTRNFVRQLPLALIMACALPFVMGSGGCGKSDTPKNGAEQVRLNAGGSSFVYPLMSKWASVYGKEKGSEVNYQSIGSGGGIQKMINQEFDFGCTDAPLNEEQLKKAMDSGGPALHIPLAMGAVALIYNLDEVNEPLNLSGPVIADIFLRKIKKWNDERIRALNPKIADQLPDKNIVVYHRTDGSGTTYVFADYLAKVSKDWKESTGVSTSLKWAEGTEGAKGSEGVAGKVKLNPGAIGYVEVTYALQNKMKFAAIQNQAGEFSQPTLQNVTTAAENSLKNIPEDLRFSITDAPGNGSYPISGTVWAVIYQKMPAVKGQAVVGFLRWATRANAGQKYASELDYAPLPPGLIERIDQKLASVTFAK